MGFRLAQLNVTLDDLEGSKTKVTVFDVKYVDMTRLHRQQQPGPFAKNLWPSCFSWFF